MTDRQERAGAVVYAKDVARVSAFYVGVAGFVVEESEDGYVALGSSALQLVVVGIPAAIAADVVVSDPPVRREETPIKLVLPVDDLGGARTAAAGLGGVVDGPEREWDFQGHRVVDGHDPEGNVFQVRAR